MVNQHSYNTRGYTEQHRGQELLPEQQAELNRLVEMELQAATTRTAALMQQGNL